MQCSLGTGGGDRPITALKLFAEYAMKSDHDHYDGTDPNTPLKDDHFSAAERQRSRDLGDGSPAVEEPVEQPAPDETESKPREEQG